MANQFKGDFFNYEKRCSQLEPLFSLSLSDRLFSCFSSIFNLVCFMFAISKHTSLYHSQRFHKPLCLCTSNVL
nr:MAG TPA: hypothetical protein [Caudoviricetes sp.]